MSWPRCTSRGHVAAAGGEQASVFRRHHPAEPRNDPIKVMQRTHEQTPSIWHAHLFGWPTNSLVQKSDAIVNKVFHIRLCYHFFLEQPFQKS
jgi:hypothetical protein